MPAMPTIPSALQRDLKPLDNSLNWQTACKATSACDTGTPPPHLLASSILMGGESASVCSNPFIFRKKCSYRNTVFCMRSMSSVRTKGTFSMAIKECAAVSVRWKELHKYWQNFPPVVQQQLLVSVVFDLVILLDLAWSAKKSSSLSIK